MKLLVPQSKRWTAAKARNIYGFKEVWRQFIQLECECPFFLKLNKFLRLINKQSK